MKREEEKMRRDDAFFLVLNSKNRDVYKKEVLNVLYNMSVGGYILAVFGIKV